MSIELVKALLYIVKVCSSCGDYQKCVLHEFCGKLPSEW